MKEFVLSVVLFQKIPLSILKELNKKSLGSYEMNQKRIEEILRKHSGTTHWESCADSHDICFLVSELDPPKEFIWRLVASLQSCANPEAHLTILKAL